MDPREQLFGYGLARAQKIKRSFLGGVSFGAFGAATGMAMIGFQAARAGRGGFVPAVVGQSFALAVSIPISGVAAAAISLIPGIGPFAAVAIGGLMVDYGEARFGSILIRKVRCFTDLHKRIRHLEMGGSYQDSESSQRQRFLAIQDMNSSMIPGRRYLGQEALLMHR